MDMTPSDRLALMVDGYLATQLLFVAADLGLADRVADGPRTAASLASETGVAPDTLHRVLRGLASFGVFVETDDGFALNDMASLLREGQPGSFRGLLLGRGELYYPAFARLRDAVRDGGNAFELAYGTSFFQHLHDNPVPAAAFQKSMTYRSRWEADAIVGAYEFGRFGRLVDVGGGHGVLAGAIASAHPELDVVLFDQPGVADRAEGLPPNCSIATGDFFGEITPGADAYLMSRVIHDWSDADAGRILSSTRKAMGPDATLLVVDALLPDRAVDAPAVVRMDLHMLGMFHGRERSQAEFADLFSLAGFRFSRAVPVDASAGLHILEAHPA